MNELEIIRVAGDDESFISLVAMLDAELAERDGKDHAFYHQYNGLDDIFHAVVVRYADQAVACGAVKHFDDTSVEIKRMYTLPEYRGHRVGAVVLNELEKWSVELGYMSCKLETGKRQPEAIRLYERSGYRVIENFGPYEGVDNSVCFEKVLISM